MPPKLIAFHLPQFHPIPENDTWWGKGFTEWTNVTRARPLFPGHHQPQLPADLGFYDLRLPEARQAQADLAREYGIHGFCYYHYWFNGKRLLERPVDEILASGQPDFPFCLCWANENWTRRWDGAEQEVLIGQNYNDDDDRAHIAWLIKAFRDPRYIRVDGRPLILIYRARHLPSPLRTTEIWRTQARKAGIGELFICRVENFFNERDDPHALGFDASVDFQPDWKAIDDDVPSVVLPHEHFVVDYKSLVDRQLARPDVAHRRFPGVTPAWDNSSRRKKAAFITADSTPQDYGYWLKETIRREQLRTDEPIIFINAWNEWAEGNHLEPDQRFGHGYLEATRRAQEETREVGTITPPPLGDPLLCDRFATRGAYKRWLSQRTLSKSAGLWHDKRLNAAAPPCLQIIIRAHDCREEDLSRTLRSVAGQLYEHWQLVVVTDRPSPPLNTARIEWITVAAKDAHATVTDAIRRSDARWHVVLDGGDALLPESLLFVVQTLIDHPQCALVLCDGDQLSAEGEAQRLWLAPGVNPDWLRSTAYVGGLVTATADILLAAFDDVVAFEGAAHRLAAVLRAQETHGTETLQHLPLIALHAAHATQPVPLENRAALVQAHLARQGIPAQIVAGLSDDSCRIVYAYPGERPSVAILIAALDSPERLLSSIEGLLEQTRDLPYSVLLPLSPSTDEAVRQCLQQLSSLGAAQLKIVDVADAPPAGVANQLAHATDADVVVFVKCGLRPLSAEWLDALVRHTLRPEVGAVGARLLAADGTLQSGPLRLGLMGVLATPHHGVSAAYGGSGAEVQLEQDCSALSGDCLALRRTTFIEAGAFNETRYPDTHADADLCLRLRDKGLLVVWTPFSTLFTPVAAEAKKFAPPNAEDAPLLDDWLVKTPHDTYFNRQLTRHLNTPQLEHDPVLSHEFLPWHPQPRVYVHPADFSGCGEIRIAAPLRAAVRANRVQGGGGARLLGPWEISALAPDTIVLQRPYTDIALRFLESYRRHAKAFLVYELDDLLTRIPKENANHALFPADMEDRMARAIGLCDRLVVSTVPLAQAYGRYAKDVVVLPNRLDNEQWETLQAKRHHPPGGRLRVGWAGSTSHGGDLALIEETMRSLAGEVDWVILGFCPPGLRHLVREYHPPVDIKDYPKALAGLGLDIAIAPLAANAFNEAKSNLKQLEYGALGYPVICSNILPYQNDLPAIRVANTTQQWVKAVRTLCADREARESLGEQLRLAVRQHWMIDRCVDDVVSAWTRE